MEVRTTRFGALRVLPQDLILFDQGIIGFPELKRWCLLSDSQSPALGWLQSVDSPETALGIVSPRRFVPEYQLRAAKQDLQDLSLRGMSDAQVVVIVSRRAEGFSLNLRAPIVVNVENRRGCQVVSRDPLPVQRLLPATQFDLKRTA